jgi:phage gp36-like protein
LAAYADRTKLSQLGLSAGALANVPTTTQDEALEARSRFVDSYLKRAGYTTPINPTTNAGEAVVLAVCITAGYDCLVTRGFSPQSPDSDIRQRYLDVIKWLEMVANRQIDPGVTDPDQVLANVPTIFSDDIRGWTHRGLC